jgi:FkbM family methyltransferase
MARITDVIKKVVLTLRWVANHPLHSRHKAKAIATFMRVQVGARLVKGELCVPFPNETSLLVPPQMKGAAHFIWPSLVDFEEMSFMMHFLRPQDLFVDVGANIGAFTVLASGVTGARTMAYEPGPFAFGFLLKNVLLNNLVDRVTARQMALGSREGKIHFTAGLGTENHVVEANGTEEKIEVPIATLDNELAEKDPALIKIDVEGFESDVIDGGRKILAKPSLQALIMERLKQGNRFGRNETELHDYVRSLSFLPYDYDPISRRLQRIPDDTTGGNLIYVRDLDLVGQRLRSGAGYRFAGRTV